jgi:nicotinamidase-related amidase
MNTSIEEYLKPQGSAVLVIDMQNDFCHPQLRDINSFENPPVVKK